MSDSMLNKKSNQSDGNENVFYEDPGENTLKVDWSSDRGEVEMTLEPGHYEAEEFNAVPVSIDVDPEHLPYLAARLLRLYGEIKSVSRTEELEALLEAQINYEKHLDMIKGYEELAASEEYQSETALRRANRSLRRPPASAALD